MIIKERYQTSQDAYQQLHNTYAVLNGVPTYLSYVENWDYKIRIAKKRGDNNYWSSLDIVKINNMDLQLEPIQLGYINDKGGVARYLQRRPLRKWKQGLYAEYLTVKNNSNGVLHKFAAPMSIKNLLGDKSFLDMYYEDYPSFYRAYTQVKFFKYPSCAFSKSWAFIFDKEKDDKKPRGLYGRNQARGALIEAGQVSNILLEYKGDIVGECEGANIQLYKKFEYLTETFTEAMIHAS